MIVPQAHSTIDRPVAYCELLKQLKTLRSDCSTGADHIPAKYLKMSANHIASPLTQIINSFISNSTFPAAWKMVRVSLVPKVDSPINADQYRPIAVLPALSKVYEQLVHNQILEFIEQNFVLNLMKVSQDIVKDILLLQFCCE